MSSIDVACSCTNTKDERKWNRLLLKPLLGVALSWVALPRKHTRWWTYLWRLFAPSAILHFTGCMRLGSNTVRLFVKECKLWSSTYRVVYRNVEIETWYLECTTHQPVCGKLNQHWWIWESMGTCFVMRCSSNVARTLVRDSEDFVRETIWLKVKNAEWVHRYFCSGSKALHYVLLSEIYARVLQMKQLKHMAIPEREIFFELKRLLPKKMLGCGRQNECLGYFIRTKLAYKRD